MTECKCCQAQDQDNDLFEEGEDPVEITLNFKWPQHKYELMQFISCDEMCAVLRDVDNECRSIIKWGEKNYTLETFCEMIRGRICEILARVDE